ncbi:MAG: hypothetical protein IBJ11_07200 [Phycisphaerales bacterium]|nr:hypothetical protein [Phycisphaerales bacterium]
MPAHGAPSDPPLGPADDALALDRACDALARSREGLLAYTADDSPGSLGEYRQSIRFIPDPATGRLILLVPAPALEGPGHADPVLHVPDESADALQLLVSLEEVPDSPLTDRWQAHHGPPQIERPEGGRVQGRFAAAWIDSAKAFDRVFDGDALMGSLVSPASLIKGEPGLCKVLNTDRARLARLCQRFAGVVVPDPLCVAVGPRGLSVRARFGIVFVGFEAPAQGEAEARGAIDEMLARST